MIELFAHQVVINVRPPDDSSAVYAAIVGAFLGALGAYIVSYFADKRAINRFAKKAEQKRIDNYIDSIVLADGSLQAALLPLVKNEKILGNMAADITGNLSVNLPNSISLAEGISKHFFNLDLANKWLSLCASTNLLNQLIQEFNNHYTKYREIFLDTQLRGGTVDSKTAKSEEETLKGLSGVLSGAVGKHIERTVDVLATIKIHAKISNFDTTAFKTVEEIKKFSLPLEWQKKEVAELSKKFTFENLFKEYTNR